MARKQLKGTIKKLSSAKTVAVEVVRVYHHPLYHKRIRSSKTYLAHFEGEVEVGQPVVIGESRPISKSKRWVVVEVGGKPVSIPKTDNRKTQGPRAGSRKRLAVSQRGGRSK